MYSICIYVIYNLQLAISERHTGKLRFMESGTLPETNIAPENRPFQKETSIPTIHFQVRCVSFREGIEAL